MTSKAAAVSERKSSLASPLLLLFLIATLIRGVVLFASLDSFNDDPDAYLKLSQNWYSYGVYGDHTTPTAFRPPLYPAALKALVSIQVRSERPKKLAISSESGAAPDRKRLTPASPRKDSGQDGFFDRNVALSRNASIALLHWILGVASALFVWFYARRVGLSPNQATLAGLFVVLDPILLQQSRLIMTETFAAFFSILLLLTTVGAVNRRASRWSAPLYALTGALYGLATLCRPAFYAFTCLVFLNLLAIEGAAIIKTARGDRAESESSRPPLALLISNGGLRLVCFFAGVAAIAAPWGIRNYHVFNKPILTTTHGGYTLYLANNPELYAHYIGTGPMTLWDPTSFHTRRAEDYDEALKESGIVKGSPEEELFQNVWTHSEAIKTIRTNKSTFLYSCAMRVAELWRMVPNDTSALNEQPPVRHEKKIAGIPASELKTYARYSVGAFYLVEFALCILGCVVLVYRRRAVRDVEQRQSLLESPLIWGFLLIVSVQIPHLFYWTNMRMRAPLEIFLPVLAILSVALLKRQKPETSLQIR